MKIIISCGKVSLLLFFVFLLVVILAFSFLNVYNSGKIVLNNEQSRIKFLEELGFNNMDLIAEPKEIIIPTNPSNEYKEYLKTQEINGWDLYKFSGKELKLHSYKNGQTFVNLFFKGNVLVGADFCEVGGEEQKPLILNNENRKIG